MAQSGNTKCTVVVAQAYDAGVLPDVLEVLTKAWNMDWEGVHVWGLTDLMARNRKRGICVDTDRMAARILKSRQGTNATAFKGYAESGFPNLGSSKAIAAYAASVYNGRLSEEKHLR